MQVLWTQASLSLQVGRGHNIITIPNDNYFLQRCTVDAVRKRFSLSMFVCDFKIRCYACIVQDFIFLVDLSNSCILMLNSTLFSSVNVEDETKENSI